MQSIKHELNHDANMRHQKQLHVTHALRHLDVIYTRVCSTLVNSCIAVNNSCMSVASMPKPPHHSNSQVVIQLNISIVVDPVQFNSCVAVINRCITVVNSCMNVAPTPKPRTSNQHSNSSAIQ